jgi:hypothetical protein
VGPFHGILPHVANIDNRSATVLICKCSLLRNNIPIATHTRNSTAPSLLRYSLVNNASTTPGSPSHSSPRSSTQRSRNTVHRIESCWLSTRPSSVSATCWKLATSPSSQTPSKQQRSSHSRMPAVLVALSRNVSYVGRELGMKSRWLNCRGEHLSHF